MKTDNTPVAEPKAPEDPLSWLPCSKILEIPGKGVIFAQGELSTSLYLVIAGKVTLCRASVTGRSQFLLDIYQADEFFGESALIGQPHADTAVALEDTKVMAWTATELERIIGECPKLAIALMQFMLQRSAEFGRRIESFATDSIQRRLSRALIRFSDRFGHQAGDGAVHMLPLTHELLSQYVGTSREHVSEQMRQFRSDGYVRYSRRGMTIYGDALKKWLWQQNSGRQPSTEEPPAPAYPDTEAA
jgi:CRP-like cAMP-binding protein